MSTWDKTGEAWKFKQRVNETEDPFELFEALCSISEAEAGWKNMCAIFGGNLELDLKQTNREIGISFEINKDYAQENIEHISKVKTTVSDCVAAAEKRFVEAIDNWIYAVKDAEHDAENEKFIKHIGSFKQPEEKSKFLYMLHGYSKMLPAAWKTYRTLLERKDKTADSKNLELLANDIMQTYSKLHKEIFDKDAEIAYA
jgi:hypothetical protein